QFCSEFLNDRIDLDRRDVLNVMSKRRSRVGPSARAENERVLKLRVREKLVDASIKRFLRLPRDHALMPDAVYVEFVAARLRWRERDLVILRPIAVALEKHRDRSCRDHRQGGVDKMPIAFSVGRFCEPLT